MEKRKVMLAVAQSDHETRQILDDPLLSLDSKLIQSQPLRSFDEQWGKHTT